MKFKDFIPPIIIKLIKRGVQREREREYNSYVLALQDCISDAYQNVELCNMIADKTSIYIKKLEKIPFTIDSGSELLLSVINQYINIFSAKKINIVDFGGASGVHYFEIRRIIPNNISLNWYVVETPQMILSAIEKKLNNPELHFVDSLSNINVNIDFVYSSSALQYVPEPYKFLANILKLNAKWILFNRMFFNKNNRDFIIVQKSLLSLNGPGPLPQGYSDRVLSYPHTMVSFQKFNSLIINDYNLEWIFNETSVGFNINGERIEGKGLLYIRKNTKGT